MASTTARTGLSCASIALVACGLGEISPSELTATAIGETINRIHLYAAAHQHLPPDLSVLPVREGYANSTVDAWDTPLIYQISDDGILTLISLGKDHVPGGIGEDADIVSRYRWRDSRGRFTAGDRYWTVDGELDEHSR